MLAKSPGSIQIKHFKLEFEDKTQEDKLTKEQFNQYSKMKWLAAFSGQVKVINVPKPPSDNDTLLSTDEVTPDVIVDASVEHTVGT